jgi:hypothetical protein
MLGELAVLDADDVGSDPGGRPPHGRGAAMRNHVIAFRDDERVSGSVRIRLNNPSRPGAMCALCSI